MAQKNTPTFSIVTIALNNLNGLRKTHKSLRNQQLAAFEWIVIDGHSNDDTKSWLEGLEPIGYDSCWISEPDDGLYDAMNKGLNLVHGEYVLFLNSGDMLADKNTLHNLSNFIKARQNPDFIYGDALEQTEGHTPLIKHAKHTLDIKSGMPTHHQAMLYKIKCIKGLEYNTTYKIAADYDFTARFLRQISTHGCFEKPICVFETGGLSQIHTQTGRKEEFEIRQTLNLCPVWMNYLITTRQLIAQNIKTYAPALYQKLRDILRFSSAIKS